MKGDTILKKTLKVHVNEYAAAHNIQFDYDDLAEWFENGVLGQPVSDEWIRRQFKPLSRSSFGKWKAAYNVEKDKKNEEWGDRQW